MMQKAKKILLVSFFVILALIALLAAVGMTVQAAGLVDDTVDGNNLYSQYALSHYELDFFVDNSWAWLPWNWLDGIGKSVMYGLNALSNVLWLLSTYFSSATGYVLQEAYNLDFVGTAADAIGKNIQSLAGINEHGITGTGFYSGMLVWIVLFVGIYVAYMGLFKRATSKAVSAVVNMVVLLVVSGAFIAYAPLYIKNINEFSADMSSEALKVGTTILASDSNTEGKDSTTLIRDNLFAIQVKQPWLLLQFGDTNIDTVGEERVNALLASEGQDRETIVKGEIENNNNQNLSIGKVGSRLGTVIFLLIFNLLISLFVFILCGIMIFSQVLFIIYATMLPISFLLGMIPNFSGTWQKAVLKVFNALLIRTGVTLILTIAFSLSSMFYSLAVDKPFFFIAFLQIITFGGVYLKLNELLGMFSLQTDPVGGHMGRKAKHFMHRQQHRLMHAMQGAGQNFGRRKTEKSTRSEKASQTENYTPNRQTRTAGESRQAAHKQTVSERMGRAVGNVMDMPHKLKDKAVQAKDTIAAVPTNARYAVHQTKEKAVQGVQNFAGTVSQTRAEKQAGRMEQRAEKRMTVAQHRQELKRNGKKENPEYTSIRLDIANEDPVRAAGFNFDGRSPVSDEQKTDPASLSNQPLPAPDKKFVRQQQPIQSRSDKQPEQIKQPEFSIARNMPIAPPADKRKTAAKRRSGKNKIEPMASADEIKERAAKSAVPMPAPKREKRS